MRFLKVFVYLLLAIALIAGSYFGWKFYVRAKAPALDALYILPKDAAVILAFNDYQAFNEKLESNNAIWQNIGSTYNLESTKASLDSIINDLRKNNDFQTILDHPNTKLYLSYHFAGYNKFETIFSISLANIVDERLIKNYISQSYQLESIKFEDENIYIINPKGTKTKYYLTMNSGVISLCPSQTSAEKVIVSAHSYTPESKQMEQKMLKMSGKDMAANVYINYNFLYHLVSFYANDKLKKEIENLRNFSQKASLDVLLQKEHLILSGFSIQSDSTESFLGSYQGYAPSVIRAGEILPSNTTFMYYQGAEGLSKLLKARSKTNLSERNEKQLQQFKARYLVDAADYFYPWIKGELVYALTKTRSSNQNEGAYALIEATDIREAKQALSKLTKAISDIKNITIDSNITNYRSHKLHSIPYSNLLPLLFGNFFAGLENTYYTEIDNYIIFANSNSALQKIIDNYIGKDIAKKNRNS